jgi:hypothetical protein
MPYQYVPNLAWPEPAGTFNSFPSSGYAGLSSSNYSGGGVYVDMALTSHTDVQGNNVTYLGQLTLWNNTQNIWQSVTLVGNAGFEALQIQNNLAYSGKGSKLGHIFLISMWDPTTNSYKGITLSGSNTFEQVDLGVNTPTTTNASAFNLMNVNSLVMWNKDQGIFQKINLIGGNNAEQFSFTPFNPPF